MSHPSNLLAVLALIFALVSTFSHTAIPLLPIAVVLVAVALLTRP